MPDKQYKNKVTGDVTIDTTWITNIGQFYKTKNGKTLPVWYIEDCIYWEEVDPPLYSKQDILKAFTEGQTSVEQRWARTPEEWLDDYIKDKA